MTSEFPPRADHPDEVDKVAAAFEAVISEHAAIYVSTPLTTGRRSLDWHDVQAGGGMTTKRAERAFYEQVIEPNRLEASSFVSRLRRKEAQPVINPAALRDLPGWTQNDYRVMWGDVISRCVRLVVFRDGWEYSDGCTYEFFVAVKQRLQMRREDQSSLTARDGVRLIQQRVQDTASSPSKSNLGNAVLRALEPETRDSELSI